MKSYFTAVDPISPPAPYLGGKRFLAPLIISRIAEVDHSLYAEPFVGMGGVFFRRDRRPDAEVINDRNGDVVNLFRILQRHYAAFMDHLKFQLTSRREFERLSHTDPSTLTDLERAARFLYLQRTAYGGKIHGQNFGVSPGTPARFDLTHIAPTLEEIYERLTPVVIENLDWLEFVDRYDRPETLFYLDPPYWGSEDDYVPGAFDRRQFALMSERLGRLKGKAIVSLNDVAGVRETFARFRLEEAELPYMIGQASGGVKEAKEVLIYTFERPALPLFDV
jgi:DNA adenine methylase